MRVVLDTNVLFAGIAARGLCEGVVAACIENHVVIVSEHILEELRRHLVGRLRIPAAQVRENEAMLRAHCERVQPAEVEVGACRDPDDLAVLGTAVAGAADVLVTGDRDLLSLKAFRGIPVESPREFYNRLMSA